MVAPAVIDGDNVAARAFVYAIGQWPAAVATAGCAALFIGISPRLAGLAWIPFAGSALLALLGALLGIPHRIQDLGFLRHVPDIAAPEPHVRALVVLLGLGVTLSLVGAAVTARRDLVTH